MQSHKPYKRNGHIYSYVDNKVVCSNPGHNGARKWHDATKAHSPDIILPRQALEFWGIAKIIAWIAIKSIVFAEFLVIVLYYAGYTGVVASTSNVGGIIFFVFFMWSIIDKVTKGRWKRIIKTFREKRERTEVDEFGTK